MTSHQWGSNPHIKTYGSGTSGIPAQWHVATESIITEHTPATTSSTTYAAGDQLGVIMTMASAVRATGGAALLTTVSVYEQGLQQEPIDILFFDEAPTVDSSDNAALSLAAAELQGKLLGSVSIKASDYVTAGTGSIATIRNLGFVLVGDSNLECHALAVSKGTPSLSGTTGLTFRFHVIQD